MPQIYINIYGHNIKWNAWLLLKQYSYKTYKIEVKKWLYCIYLTMIYSFSWRVQDIALWNKSTHLRTVDTETPVTCKTVHSSYYCGVQSAVSFVLVGINDDYSRIMNCSVMINYFIIIFKDVVFNGGIICLYCVFPEGENSTMTVVYK